MTPAPVVSVSAVPSEPRDLAPRTFRNSAVGRLFERLTVTGASGTAVSAAHKAKSVSSQAKPSVPVRMGVESVASKRSCPPPGSGKGSRSENSDKIFLSEAGVGGESQVVEDGCLLRVHESRSAGSTFVTSVVVQNPAALVAINHRKVSSVVPDPLSAFFFNNHSSGDSKFHSDFLDNPRDRDSLPQTFAAFVETNHRTVLSGVPDAISDVFFDNHRFGDSPSCSGPVQVSDSTCRVVHQPCFTTSSPKVLSPNVNPRKGPAEFHSIFHDSSRLEAANRGFVSVRDLVRTSSVLVSDSACCVSHQSNFFTSSPTKIIPNVNPRKGPTVFRDASLATFRLEAANSGLVNDFSLVGTSPVQVLVSASCVAHQPNSIIPCLTEIIPNVNPRKGPTGFRDASLVTFRLEATNSGLVNDCRLVGTSPVQGLVSTSCVTHQPNSITACLTEIIPNVDPAESCNGLRGALRLKAARRGPVNALDSNRPNVAISSFPGLSAVVNPSTSRLVSTAVSIYEPLDSGLDFKHGSD